MALHDLRDADERRIAGDLIDRALAQGWSISVNDGEAWAIKRGRDARAIKDAMAATDNDTLVMRDQTGEELGTVWLIYGNGEDVISDCSGRGPVADLCDAIAA